MFGVHPTDQPPPHSTDASEQAMLRLVADAQKGDTTAFEQLVFLHRDQVYAIAYQMTRNADDAMDVTQDVFIRLFRALPSFKGKARFATWMHRVVLNCALDHLRHEKRHRSGKLEMDDDSNEATDPPGMIHRVSASSPPPQRKAADAQQLQQRVREALRKLSSKQRQVFILRYYHDLSILEVGEVMRSTQGTIKRHLFRAHERLKDILKDLRP